MYRLACVLLCFASVLSASANEEDALNILEEFEVERIILPEEHVGRERRQAQAYPVNPTFQHDNSDDNVYVRPTNKHVHSTNAYRVDTNSDNPSPHNTAYQTSNNKKNNNERNTWPKETVSANKYSVNLPSESAYKPKNPNVYSVNVPSESAYPIRPTHSHGSSAPSHNVYPVNSNSGSESLYPVDPPAYGRPNPQPSGGGAYGKPPDIHGSSGFPTIPPPQLSPVRPLSGGNAEEENERIPFVLIKKDNSVYASGSVPSLSDPEEDDQCEKSETLVKNRAVCKGQLLFQEDFNILNPKIWKSDISIPKKPDYEFTVFVQSKNNTYIENGNLVLKPTLLSDWKTNIVRYGKLKLDDCALTADSGSCYKEVDKYNILPPVVGARIRTQNSFNFQYGRIDIRAKMPSGDWVYPEIWLEPENTFYGRWYMSGRIVVGLVRGNSILAGPNQESMGVQLVNAGCLYRKNTNLDVNYDKYDSKIIDDGWNLDFHNYSVLWTPESMKFYVDDELIGECNPPNSDGRKQVPWKRGSNMAPFDKPFHITLGIAAGGISEFPDSITNGAGRQPKPWKNVGAKATLTFFEEQNNWQSTWDEETALKVDSITVHAL